MGFVPQEARYLPQLSQWKTSSLNLTFKPLHRLFMAFELDLELLSSSLLSSFTHQTASELKFQTATPRFFLRHTRKPTNTYLRPYNLVTPPTLFRRSTTIQRHHSIPPRAVIHHPTVPEFSYFVCAATWHHNITSFTSGPHFQTLNPPTAFVYVSSEASGSSHLTSNLRES